METIAFTLDEKPFDIPIAVAFDYTGRPAELLGNVEPQHCAHTGQTWSTSFALRCIHCGAKLFMPLKLLAYLSEAENEAMHALWEAAGWPEYPSTWEYARQHPEWGQIEAHPLFNHCNGLPVREAYRTRYVDALPVAAALLAEKC